MIVPLVEEEETKPSDPRVEIGAEKNEKKERWAHDSGESSLEGCCLRLGCLLCAILEDRKYHERVRTQRKLSPRRIRETSERTESAR